MKKRFFAILIIVIALIVGCKKKEITNTSISNFDVEDTSEIEEISRQNIDEINPFPLGKYYYMEDIFSPNGTILRVYNNEVKETLWGPIYSPIIYLFDKDNKEIANFSTIDLVSEDFWPGNINITYNAERHSFDMIFSLDGPGNYGTGYIDLNSTKYIRESTNSDNIFFHEVSDSSVDPNK